MRVYLTPPQPSLGLERIATALRRYAPPTVQISTFPRNVDLTVIYAIGRRDAIERQCRDILSRGKKYAIIQVCLRSTMSPNSLDWLPLWQRAETVWSYYDLTAALCADLPEDKTLYPFYNFYHAPLGADAEVFCSAYKNLRADKFIIATSGLSRLSESVRECWIAAKQVGKEVFHLGALKGADNVTPIHSISDRQLALYYSNCEFVSGLRRKEGFELPAVEGLLCGARPIVFDTSDYRWCYRDHAEYIQETDRQGVVDQLVELFKRGARPVTPHEREEAAHWFNWKTIVGGFYERIK